MSKLHNVRLSLEPNPNRCEIEVDGVPLTSVRGVRLIADVRSTPTLEIDIARVNASVMARARIILAPGARDDLIALRWLPLDDVKAYHWTDPRTGQVSILHPADVAVELHGESDPSEQ